MSPGPRIGTEFAGYRIEGLIGRGGMSVVYRAENIRLGTMIALKLLAAELAEDETFRERFVRESRLAASINHPNIITIYDAGDSGGVLYIAMRLVDGPDLKDLLRRDGPLDLARTLAVISQVGSALEAAHMRGLIHRDIKPANILIEPGLEPEAPDYVYLADFGLIKHLQSRSGLTGSGEFVGTIDYMAPEQIEGREVDARTDIYSLGCVLFQCLTGKPPFRKDTDAAVLWAHMREDPPLLSSLNPELPEALDDVIARALAKDPDDRYPSCRELVAELRAEAGARSIPGTAPLRVEGTRRLRGRRGTSWRRTLPAAAGAALLLAAAASGLTYQLTQQTEKTAALGSKPTTVVQTRTVFGGLTDADKVLRTYVPKSIRGSCSHAPRLTLDFSASISCRAGTQAARVQYNLARSTRRMRVYFESRAVGEGFTLINGKLFASGFCTAAEKSVRDWVPRGKTGHREAPPGLVEPTEPLSRVMCYRQNGWASIEWTDNRNDVYTQAFGFDRNRLYGWWKNEAGPLSG